jgi:hypothetical protein
MPNHCANGLTVKHKDKEMMDLFKTFINREKSTLDFNKIIPMPEELAITVSPTIVVKTQDEADKINSDYVPTLGEGTTTRAISKQEHARREKLFDAENWLDWSCNNWGTKWNSYNGEIIFEDDNKIVMQFYTAWCPPIPIFEKLEKMGFDVSGAYTIEGDCESDTFGNGENEWYIQTSIEYGG